MGSNEFVILLGDETESESTASEEFLVLLDAPIAASLALPAQACIAQVAKFYQQLAERFTEVETLVVEASQVSQFDTAFAQLLISAARKAEASGGRLQLQAASDVLRETMVRLGLAAQLECLVGPQRGKDRDAQVL